MAQNKIGGIANLIYPIIQDGNKDEITAFASALVRSPDNYELSDMERMNNQDALDELIRGKFTTQDNETKYKQVLSVVSAVLRGTIDAMDVDIIIDKSDVKALKDSGQLANLNKSGTAGRYALFTIETE